MKFNVDPEFETYWPALPEEKLIILEKSILDDGLHENLVVWKEENILLDGHQRLRILTKHNISFDNRIDYLSFPDRLHAKRWVHVTQIGRRGDVPKLIAVFHVLEFEPLYIEEARNRQKEHGGTAPGKHSGIKDTEVLGRSRLFMARDSGQGEHTISRVLYIRKHDPQKFADLIARAKSGEEIIIHREHSIVKGIQDAKQAEVKIDKETLEKFESSNTVDAFSEAVRKFKPPLEVQRAAAESIVANDKTANKNFVEDEIIHRMPKKKSAKEKDKPGLSQLKNSMQLVTDYLNKSIEEIKHLTKLREQFGDDLYFRALADSANLRAAFAECVVQAKYINKTGDKNEPKEIKKSRLLHP